VKAIAISDITVISRMRFNLPVSATLEGNDNKHFGDNVPGSIDAGATIGATEIRRINHQHEPKGFIFPIIVACVEATSVIISLSPFQLPSTKFM